MTAVIDGIYQALVAADSTDCALEVLSLFGTQN